MSTHDDFDDQEIERNSETESPVNLKRKLNYDGDDGSYVDDDGEGGGDDDNDGYGDRGVEYGNGGGGGDDDDDDDNGEEENDDVVGGEAHVEGQHVDGHSRDDHDDDDDDDGGGDGEDGGGGDDEDGGGGGEGGDGEVVVVVVEEEEEEEEDGGDDDDDDAKEGAPRMHSECKTPATGVVMTAAESSSETPWRSTGSRTSIGNRDDVFPADVRTSHVVSNGHEEEKEEDDDDDGEGPSGKETLWNSRTRSNNNNNNNSNNDDNNNNDNSNNNSSSDNNVFRCDSRSVRVSGGGGASIKTKSSDDYRAAAGLDAGDLATPAKRPDTGTSPAPGQAGKKKMAEEWLTKVKTLTAAGAPSGEVKPFAAPAASSLLEVWKRRELEAATKFEEAKCTPIVGKLKLREKEAIFGGAKEDHDRSEAVASVRRTPSYRSYGTRQGQGSTPNVVTYTKTGVKTDTKVHLITNHGGGYFKSDPYRGIDRYGLIKMIDDLKARVAQLEEETQRLKKDLK